MPGKSTIPGLLTALITFVAPSVSWQAIFILASTQPQANVPINDQMARAMTDVHLQLASLCLGLLSAALTSTVYLISAGDITKQLKLVCGGCLALASILFIYVFAMGGAASIPFDAYVRPGPFEFRFDHPPWQSWLTYVRGIVMVLGLSLAAFSPKD